MKRKLRSPKIAEQGTFPDTVEVSRNYAGKLEISFGEEICLDESAPIEIDADICASTGGATRFQ